LKLGWTEGKNVRIELRWAGPDPDRINTMAKELADLRPDAILGQTTPAVRALAREMEVWGASGCACRGWGWGAG